MKPLKTSSEIGKAIYRGLMTHYLHPLYKEIESHPTLVSTVPGFLLKPEKVIIYIGRTHISVEYIGSETLDSLPVGEELMEMEVHDYSKLEGPLLNRIIGFDYSENPTPTPLPSYSDDLVVPTNNGVDALNDAKWNYNAQSMMFAINSGGMEPQKGRFSRLINAKFFDSAHGDLLTRYVKWMDFFPLSIDESAEKTDTFTIDFSILGQLVKSDARTPFPRPKDIQWGRLTRLNDFTEMIADKSYSEPQITKFLSSPDYQFILKMRFAADKILPEKLCKWQSEPGRNDIQPDFFSVGSDGFAEIIEFKLPYLKSKAVVGSSNRERFSAEISSHISQTANYIEYFDDPNNRNWTKQKYGFEIYKPRRTIVIGRRSDLDTIEFKKLEREFIELRIITYDDLIDGVRGMLY